MSDERIAKDWVDSYVRWAHDELIAQGGVEDIGGILDVCADEVGPSLSKDYGPTSEFWVGIAKYFAGKVEGIWGEYNVLRIMREQNVTRNTAVYVWKAEVRFEERRAKRREQADINAALGLESLI